jgi:hypothetical protein
VNCIAETGSVTKRTPLPPKVIEVYTAVGKLLKHYKSGKLPRALKMMPHLKVRKSKCSFLSSIVKMFVTGRTGRMSFG